MQAVINLRFVKLGVLCFALCLVSLSTASAQQPRNRFGSEFRNRPTVSPYLSLVDGGGTANLFNIVRPRQQAQRRAKEFQKELDNVESEFQRAQQPLPQGPSAEVPITTGRMSPTGHGATFGDLNGYFGNPTGRGNKSSSSSRGNAGTGRAGFGGVGTVGFGGGGSAAYGGGYGGGYGSGVFGGGVFGGNNVFGGTSRR